MAICDEFPQIKVTVNVDGSEAAEYDDDEDAPDNSTQSNVMNTVVKYIESQDDAAFSISLSADPSYNFQPDSHSLSCCVTVDGKRIRTAFLSKRKPSVTVIGRHWCPKGSSAWKVQPLKFAGISAGKSLPEVTANLSLTKAVESAAEARVKEDSMAVKSLGLIQVRIARCVVTGQGTLRSRAKLTAVTTELAEKALKGSAVSHGTSYGADVDISAPKYVDTVPLDNGSALIRFDFKYRSRESLQKLLIIPRTPSPDLVEEEMESLSQEAIRSLARRQLLQERASSSDTIKAENRTVFKKEPEVYDLTGDAPFSARKRKRVDTIDLTDD